VRVLIEGREVDAAFASCTSIRLLAAVRDIDAECGLPMTSSNHALAGHYLRLAGLETKLPELGRLFVL
jgi:maleate isomerase